MAMSKEEFRRRWNSGPDGGGITCDDCADCYVAWGLGDAPRTKPIANVITSVCKAAGCDVDHVVRDNAVKLLEERLDALRLLETSFVGPNGPTTHFLLTYTPPDLPCAEEEYHLTRRQVQEFFGLCSEVVDIAKGKVEPAPAEKASASHLNAAAMREALLHIEKLTREFNVGNYSRPDYTQWVLDSVRFALAAPARNCDRIPHGGGGRGRVRPFLHAGAHGRVQAVGMPLAEQRREVLLRRLAPRNGGRKGGLRWQSIARPRGA